MADAPANDKESNAPVLFFVSNEDHPHHRSVLDNLSNRDIIDKISVLNRVHNKYAKRIIESRVGISPPTALVRAFETVWATKKGKQYERTALETLYRELLNRLWDSRSRVDARFQVVKRIGLPIVGVNKSETKNMIYSAVRAKAGQDMELASSELMKAIILPVLSSSLGLFLDSRETATHQMHTFQAYLRRRSFGGTVGHFLCSISATVSKQPRAGLERVGVAVGPRKPDDVTFLFDATNPEVQMVTSRLFTGAGHEKRRESLETLLHQLRFATRTMCPGGDDDCMVWLNILADLVFDTGLFNTDGPSINVQSSFVDTTEFVDVSA